MKWRSRSQIGVSRKIRNDYSDFDYIDKLDDKSLTWLKAFNREYYNADFKHKYKKLHRSKTERRICFGSNNSRNRDIYALLKTRRMLVTFGLKFEKENVSIKLTKWKDRYKFGTDI